MKAHLLTDIHNEHRDALYRVKDLDFDILILAGDIDSGLGGITWAAEEPQRLGVPAIYVAVNHEFYGTRNAYCSHLDHLVAQADYWLYGHTHAALNTRVEQTRLVTNPAGYPGQKTGFNPDLVIDPKGEKAK